MTKCDYCGGVAVIKSGDEWLCAICYDDLKDDAEQERFFIENS